MDPLLSSHTIELVVVVAANLYNLLMTAIFFTRLRGWRRWERVIGLVVVFLALPLAAAAAVNWLSNREWWFRMLPIPLVLFSLLQLLLVYIIKRDPGKTRLRVPYLALLHLGQWSLIGYAFVAEPVYGLATLATYVLCLGAGRYAQVKGAG